MESKDTMESKKYKLLETDTIDMPDGHIRRKLYRIQAVISFEDVTAGDLGGYVESEKNLSHLGGCWIYDEAYCFGNGRVIEEAWIAEFSEVRDNAVVSGEAWVEGNSSIQDNALVTESSWVKGWSVIKGLDKISGATVIGDSEPRPKTDYSFSLADDEMETY